MSTQFRQGYARVSTHSGFYKNRTREEINAIYKSLVSSPSPQEFITFESIRFSLPEHIVPESEHIRGLGLFSRRNYPHGLVEYPHDTRRFVSPSVDHFDFFVDPYLVSPVNLKSFSNKPTDPRDEGMLLVYSRTLSVEYDDMIFRSKDKRHSFLGLRWGPAIPERPYCTDLTVESGSSSVPQVILLSGRTKVVPLYERDLEALMKFLEEYKRID